MKEEASEKSLLALARRQRRMEGLQLFEKTKLNRYDAIDAKVNQMSFFFFSV